MRCQIPCRQAAVWVRKELIVMNNTHSEAATETPFDTAKLDRLMGEADLDVLVVTSRHNVQYLLGGYRFFFFDVMDAIGVSRYLPVVVYQRGRPENTFYVGNRMEGFERELGTIPAPIVLGDARRHRNRSQAYQTARRRREESGD